MAVVISMLRGVNLAKHRRMKMEELRQVYESVGLRDVRTYVQSGNVVFRTARVLKNLAGAIEDAIERKFGFRAAVILRTAAEVRETIANNPFAERSGIEPAKLLVWFLASDPGEEARRKVMAIPACPEEIHLAGRELYIYYTNGMARPKLPMALIEKTLGVPGTGRNWNTVGKLLEMAEGLEADDRRL